MATPQLCTDTSDVEELNKIQRLFLKPCAKVSINVQLPALKEPNRSISNWELMEKLKAAIQPLTFLMIKVSKSSIEFVRFEAEVENKAAIHKVISVLDQKTLKLAGFPEPLKIRAGEGKQVFPMRHDWEAYFRDARNMNEMKPGERPDTVYIENIPCKWFSTINPGGKNQPPQRDLNESCKPSEFILKKVFEAFGEIRCVDIPMLDPYRREMRSIGGNLPTFNFGPDLLFSAYIQYKDYIAFVKAMTALRGMKLMNILDDNKAYIANIKVEFDRTKHLSDKSIRKRKLERDHLQQLETAKADAIRKQRDEEERMKEEKRVEDEARHKAREERRKAREEKRAQRRQQKKKELDEQEMRMRIAMEERRLRVAERKLDAIRVLSEVFERIKVIKQKEEVRRRLEELEIERIRQLEREQRKKLHKEHKKQAIVEQKKHEMNVLETELKSNLMSKLKSKKEREDDIKREKLRDEVSKKQLKLQSAVRAGGSRLDHCMDPLTLVTVEGTRPVHRISSAGCRDHLHLASSEATRHRLQLLTKHLGEGGAG